MLDLKKRAISGRGKVVYWDWFLLSRLMMMNKYLSTSSKW